MNAPVPEKLRQAFEAIELNDRYTSTRGRAFMSGTHALVRLPMMQQMRDAQAGFRTGGFISGYRGSPLGTYDQALVAAGRFLKAHDIVFQPGVNEELAVDSVWGSQQLEFDPASKKLDGVFGIWYGKGPGVDRSADALKHANLSGTASLGGVIAVAGDDHLSKSSTLAHQSDHTFMACGLPVFAPSNVQDILDLGLHAFALSRYAGLWAGMKTVQDVVESAAAVDVDPQRVRIMLPEDFAMPTSGVHIRWPDEPLVQEARLMQVKWPAAIAYVRANRLNHNVIASANDRLGIIASGKSFGDVRQALRLLGLDDAQCRALGLRLHKVNVVWPLEPQSMREFALGLQEVLVVEEKRPIIELQLKDELYHCPPSERPRVIGKYDLPDIGDAGGEWSHTRPEQDWLLRANADLTPALIAQAIAKRLKYFGVPADVQALIDSRLSVILAKERAQSNAAAQSVDRLAWFCSGCPHNTSTRVPEGSTAMAGIGCHGMAVWMDRSTTSWSQMGGEGTPWIGQAPFTTRQHMFANLGDGTYFHSGLLAIRQSIAAGVNITYKVLYNDAVAMTGGQQVGERPEGHSVAQIAHSLRAEGVVKMVVVTDEPEKYSGRTVVSPTRAGHPELVTELPPGVTVHHRDELDRIQREFRELKGTSIIIYDQTCATEKRRRRKRGSMVDPAKRVVINELVCEGCGDCSVQSNCLSVEPIETEFGRKRRINQNSCNKDFSCVKGFCPSFVTVEGGQLKKPKKDKKGDLSALSAIPEPVLPLVEQVWGIVVGGVGGTGVITIGQLLGMAAHLEGKGVVTQDTSGLAQKGGATWSHIQIANRPGDIYTSKVGTAKADLVIGCDPIVAANKSTLDVMLPGHTHVVLNSHGTPTAAFVSNPDWQFPSGDCASAIDDTVGRELTSSFDAEQVAVQMLGDSIYTNPLMLGFAWQKGRVPLSHAALMRAIELNGVQIDNNKAAFEWGRRCAHDLAAVQALFKAAQIIEFVRKPSLAEMLAKRVDFLAAYQNAAYAQTYITFVEKVRAAEAPLNSTQLSEAVARYLFKLMAYKDEYEVARLHTDRAFTEKIASMFEGDYKLIHHLAPPLTAKKNDQGELIKQPFGPWMRSAFGLLAKMKGLRGTPLDIFGRSAERRMERALIVEYRACIEELLTSLNAERLALAAEIARIPEQIRGYGHVKERHLAAVRPKWQALMEQWRNGASKHKFTAVC